MKKIHLLFLIFALLLLPVTSALAANPTLRSDTLAAVYIDAARLFAFYTGQAAELVKPENADKLAEIEKQFKGYARLELSLSDFFKKIDDFAGKELFLPDGSFWFTLDSSFHPSLEFKAKVKPLEFIEFLESHLGKIEQEAVKREKDLVEYSIPTPDFKMLLSLRPDGIHLQSEGVSKEPEDKEKWADLLTNVAAKDTMVAAEIDLNGLKHLVAGKNANAHHGVCFSNLRIFAAALEMYAMDKGSPMKTLDQKQLKADHYLNSELTCPNAGTYALKGDSEVNCTVHGTIKEPVKTAETASDNDIPAQFRPFETLRIKALKDFAEAGIKLNDKNLADQWAAIGKQQLLAIKNMAQNQMGQLPESERQKGMKMLEAVKINQNDYWLKVSVEGLDEKTMLSGMTGLAGAMAAIAIPNFVKARESAQSHACKANRRLISGALEMYQMDTGKNCETLDLPALVNAKYIKTIPQCKNGGIYSLTQDKEGVTIKCSHHKD